MSDLKLIVLDNFKEVGEKVVENLEIDDCLIDFKASRFSNGEGKVNITGTVRGRDIFILSDIGNYGITYKMHGLDHRMSPDDHFQDIKRVISAISGQADKITIVMPLLYQSRQHRKKGKESLDCALALQELERLGVNHIVTMDCHDPNVCNAIPNLPFENFYPTNTILEDYINNENTNDLLVISPDAGAMDRARYYAEMLGVDVGLFYKRRDLSKIVNGKNPIVEHMYMGSPIEGKNILVVDDMIASGSSMLDVGKKLKEQGANEVTFIATFSLFTEGIEEFDKAYKAGLFDKLYTTNLTYIPKEYQEKEWFHTVDCSKRLAGIISTLHKHESIKPINNSKEKIMKLLEDKNNHKVKELHK